MKRSFISLAAFLYPVPLAVFLRSTAIQPLLSSEYSPRRALYLSHPGLLWTNVISDSLITIAYVLFFFGIRFLVRKLRHIEYMRSRLWVLSAFNIFILSCGATVLLRVITIWYPLAQISIGLKVICAAASLPTAVVFAWRAREIVNGVTRFFDLLATEKHQTEALRKSELFLDRTNRVAGIGGWELDLLTMDLTWSAESARMHGLPPGYKPQLDEAIGYFGRSYQPTLQAALQRVLDGGSGWDLELPLYRVDGRKLWVRLIGEPEKVGGRPIRVFGSVQDKTEEVEQRETLRRSQIFLDRTNRVAGIGGWDFDIATKDLVWSDQTARIHGMPPGHKPTYEESFSYFPQEYHPYIQREVDAAFAGDGVYDLELPLIRPDGQRIWVRLIGEVQFVDGKPSRIFGSLQDKTFEVEQREALRKSQGFLDRTNRIAGVGSWEIDIATEVVTWSAETYRIHGLPSTFIPTVATGISFYADKDRSIIAAAVEQALETGQPWDLELQFIRADDRPIWVRTVGNVEMKDGRPIRIVGAIQDKTAQVNTRIALEHANERITLAMEGGGIGIWDWDIQSNRFICDAWMFRMHGLEYEEGPTEMAVWTGRLHPDDRPVTVARLLDALEGNSQYRTEFRVIWDDNSTHIIQASGEVFRDPEGHPLRMIGIHRDVTESRRLANEFQQQHELLSVTLSSISDAVVSVDANLNVLWMNGAAERMSGWKTSDAIGRPSAKVLSIVYEDSRQPAPVYIDPELSHIRRISMSEKVVIVGRNGTELAVESCATPIYDSASRLSGSVLVISDITEQLQHARETEQINKLQLDLKLKDQFLSHVSHELRSPLTSVYSFTSIVADGLAGETTDEQQQYLQIVLKNVVQLQAMIEDLLTVTQSKEGRIPIATEDTTVAPVIRDAVNTSYPAAAAKQISIETIGADKAPIVRADPTRLQQIMIILLDNAIKFTPDGGHVRIRFVEDGEILRFEVEDNGCGIPLDKRARVFEKLYQILGPEHADTSLQGRIGLGLGLHIARDLVRRQGGNIWITGEPEKGSIFNFTLKIASMASESDIPRLKKAHWPSDSQLSPAA